MKSTLRSEQEARSLARLSPLGNSTREPWSAPRRMPPPLYLVSDNTPKNAIDGVRLSRSRKPTVFKSIYSIALIVFGVMVVVLGIIFVHVRNAINTPTTVASHVYVVNANDTIWSIANRFSNGTDPSYMEYELMKELGSTIIFPGEKIRIP